jgi:small subunit ribosomal protein S7
MAEQETTNDNVKTEATTEPKKRTRAKRKEPGPQEPKGSEAAKQPASEQQEKQKEVKTVQPIQRKQRKVELGVEEQLLFEKYALKDVVISDQSLANYMNLVPRSYPNIHGRRLPLAYYMSHISIVERLVNKLMRGGTGQKIGGKVIRTEGKLQGKKLKVMHIVEDAFDIVSKQTSKNPIQVFIDALQRAAPIEDTTRVRYGGITYNVAVDISSVRRVNVALNNLALAAILGAFKNRRSLSDALANEIILAANNDPNSFAIKKRIEAERMARSAR